MSDKGHKRRVRRPHLTISAAISLTILLAATGLAVLIQRTEPSTQPTGATKRTAMLVDTVTAQRGNFRPQIEALGTVQPALDIVLSPRVGGEIVERGPNFIPGGFVKKSEALLKIDPADYENALMQRRGELRSAVADLRIEEGRQEVARQEYAFLNEQISGDNKSLVLRQPQLDAARAAVDAARAAVRQAELDLERTAITAPFDAQVLTRNVNVGSQVAPGAELGRLVGTDEYWVVATVPLAKLQRIAFADGAKEGGSPARIRNRGAWPQGVFRSARVERLIGTLDAETRLARLLVTVPDPLALQPQTEGPRLLLDSLLHLRIEGRELSGVVRLNRDHVREKSKVWVMDQGKLSIRDTEIVFRDMDYAYVRSGLKDGEQVVTTNLATVTEGAPLRRREAKGTDMAKRAGGDTAR